MRSSGNARGEEFYRKAAEAIIDAQKVDPTLGQREIAAWFGRSHTWVQDIVRWHTSGKGTRGQLENAPTPYAEEQGAVAKRHAKSVLKRGDQAPPASNEANGEDDRGKAAEKAAEVMNVGRATVERVLAVANRSPGLAISEGSC